MIRALIKKSVFLYPGTAMLIASLLALLLIPAHFHVHHDEEGHGNAGLHSQQASHGHKHKIDVHIAGDDSQQAHHDEVTVIDASSDTLPGKVSKGSLLLAFLVILLLLPQITLTRITGRHRPVFSCPRRLSFFTPLLRAPPALS